MLENHQFNLLKTAKEWSIQADIPGFIEANSHSNITITEWLGLGEDPFTKKYGIPNPIKEAIKYEARRINNEINKKREKEISDLKMSSQEVNRSNLKPEITGNNMSKVFR